MDYNIGKDESDRIQFMKLVFCIMVVIIHAKVTEVWFADGTATVGKAEWLETLRYIASDTICRCAVPGFFLISAVLLYRNDFSWGQNIKRKIRSLLFPYFILNTFWIVVFYSVYKIKIFEPFLSGRQIRSAVAQWGLMDWADAYLGIVTGCPIVYPLWFIRELFLLNVCSKALKYIIDRFPKIWFMVMIIALFLNINSRAFFQITDAVAFFSFGYYIVKYDMRFKDLDKINAIWIGFVYAVFAVGMYLTKGMQVCNIIRALSNVAGIMFYARISRFFLHKKYADTLLGIAKYNLSIYFFHEYSLTLLKKIWFKVFSETAILLNAAYFSIPLLVIIFCIALGRIIEKIMPGLYGILTGGRKL